MDKASQEIIDLCAALNAMVLLAQAGVIPAAETINKYRKLLDRGGPYYSIMRGETLAILRRGD